MNKVDAILTADWHLRDSQPICRTDNFFETQWNKVCYIADLQEKYDCPVLHAGDLFHFWKPSPYLLSHALQLMPKDFITVYGNHDLPAHRLEERNRSGIHTLEMAGKIDVVIDGSWGWDINEYKRFHFVPLADRSRWAFIWHKFVWQGAKPYPEADPMDKVESIMKIPALKDCDLIVTGDHHSAFKYEAPDGRLLVNPGQITRQAANANSPVVWLYNAESNTAEPHEIPHKLEHVTRKHLDIKKEKEENLTAFIEGLTDEFDLGATFQMNLRLFVEANKVDKSVANYIWEALEDERARSGN